MKQYTVNDCELLTLPQMSDERGHLAILEGNNLPIDVERIFFIYNVPLDKNRGGHAHREQTTILFALNGKMKITLFDGESKRILTLEHPTEGLVLLPGIWSDLSFENVQTVCLALSSGMYTETDYIRSYEEFIALKTALVL